MIRDVLPGELTDVHAGHLLARHLGATLVTADRKLAESPGLDVPVIAPG